MSELMMPELVTVTPAVAKKWLRSNTHNRNVRPLHVSALARDMAAGRWQVNGETVKFGEDGTLLDGQHRLLAVLEADTAVQMWVIRGIPVVAQATMDGGAKRTTKDILGMEGVENAAVVASVVKRAVMWERSDYTFKGQVSTPEAQNYLQKNPGILRSAEMATMVRGMFRPLQPSVTGVSHWILSGVAPDEVPWFFARLADGATMESQHPIMVLRRRLMDEALDRTKRVPDYTRLAYVIRAWNAVRDGRTISKIQQRPADAMPMPR